MPAPLALLDALDPRRKSLIRANLLVLVSFFVAVHLSGFPRTEANPWIAAPLVLALLGTADTLRCIRRRWSFYHGGVVLCVYMDLMALCLIAFLLVYPYGLWLSSSH